MRRFFIPPEQVRGATAVLTGSEAHQIRTVLRMKTGESLQLFDRSGFEYDAVIERIESDAIRLQVVHRSRGKFHPALRLGVAQAMLKEKKMDKLLRQLCELGMTHWMPFVSRRSVSRPAGNRLDQRRERWEKIALAAMKQCRRSDPIDVAPPMAFQKVLKQAGGFKMRILFWEEQAGCFDPDRIFQGGRSPESVMILLGPEGGLTAAEVAAARDAGFVTAGLGPRILRAETAALAAGVLMQYLFGDLGQKALDKK
jgi:16S rRNA (uracil1498-N3)-methyltransferase